MIHFDRVSDVYEHKYNNFRTWCETFDSNKVVWTARTEKFGEWRANRKMQKEIAIHEANKGDGDNMQQLLLSLD
jgi:hypothetical protein